MEVDAVFGTYYIASRVPTILVRTEMRIKYANAVEKALVVSIYKCLNMYPVCPQTCVVPTGFSENCGGALPERVVVGRESTRLFVVHT